MSNLLDVLKTRVHRKTKQNSSNKLSKDEKEFFIDVDDDDATFS